MEMTTMPPKPVAFITAVLVALLAGLLSANLSRVYGWGPDRESDPPLLTLDFRNEPLRDVLGKISRTTGWKIEAPDRWMEKPVTQTVNRVTLEEGLRSVLRSAGVENLMLMYDENVKVVTLFDTEGPQRQSAGTPPAQVNAQQRYYSTSGQPDPILERAAERASGNTPPPGRARSRRLATPEGEE